MEKYLTIFKYKSVSHYTCILSNKSLMSTKKLKQLFNENIAGTNSENRILKIRLDYRHISVDKFTSMLKKLKKFFQL